MMEQRKHKQKLGLLGGSNTRMQAGPYNGSVYYSSRHVPVGRVRSASGISWDMNFLLKSPRFQKNLKLNFKCERILWIKYITQQAFILTFKGYIFTWHLKTHGTYYFYPDYLEGWLSVQFSQLKCANCWAPPQLRD